MKSAMQELIEWHRKSIRSYSETNKMIETLLKKEKEQIKMAFIDGAWDGLKKIDSEEYYNQNYGKA